jgi:hypothetical protein
LHSGILRIELQYNWAASVRRLPQPGDNYFYAHTQFDVQGSYRVYKGLRIVASGLNLSNEVFGFYHGNGIYPVRREYYKPTYSFGLRWTVASE